MAETKAIKAEQPIAGGSQVITKDPKKGTTRIVVTRPKKK